MDLTAEAIKELQKSGEPTLFNINHVDYSSRQLHPVKPYLPDALKVITLNALVDLFGAGWEEMAASKPVVHVESPSEVTVLSSLSNDAGERTVFVRAKLGFAQSFKFGEWMSQEAFIIALQSQFAPTPQRDQVLKVASKIASEDKLTVEDTGVHQTVTAKTGVALVDQVDISPRIALIPWRTFREVTQPESEFVFRIKKGPTGLPLLALFEADGGQWQLVAMNHIANYLSDLLKTVPVVQ